MAVIINPMDSRLQLKLNTGTDDNGKPVYRTKSLSNIKASTADEDVMNVAQVLAGLQQYTLASVTRINQNELVNA